MRRAGRAWVVSAALGVLLASLAGCGYHVGGKGDLLPKTLHTIACPAFSNATTKYKLTGLLPQEIGREFTARTSYKVVADPKNADAVLEGVIAGYYAAPTVYDPVSYTHLDVYKRQAPTSAIRSAWRRGMACASRFRRSRA